MKRHCIPTADGSPPIEVEVSGNGDVLLWQKSSIDSYDLVILRSDQAEKLLLALDLLLSGNDEDDE